MVVGEVLVFPWFVPNFIADAAIQPEKTFPLKTLRAPEAFHRPLIWHGPHSSIKSPTARWIAQGQAFGKQGK
jgi:hypothetical protein